MSDNDQVVHPVHYNSHPSGIECIEVIRHFNHNIGAAVKYLWRAGLKDGESNVKDIKKAIFYLEDELARIQTPPGRKARAMLPQAVPPAAMKQPVMEPETVSDFDPVYADDVAPVVMVPKTANPTVMVQGDNSHSVLVPRHNIGENGTKLARSLAEAGLTLKDTSTKVKAEQI